jgi:ABC-type glycerol-3-phosphate transport system substrate-binding protein
MRSVLNGVLLTSLVLGCSSESDDPHGVPDTSGGGDDVTLRIATYLSSPDEQAALDAVLIAHKAQHPNVHVELEPLLLSPPGTIAQLTGDKPIPSGWDLAIHTFTSVPGVTGVTLDLNTLDALKPLKKNYLPAVAQGMEATGIWAGMPLGVAGFNVAIFNKESLSALGVARPPSSLDELVHVCDQYVALGKGSLPVPLGEASDEFGPLVVMAGFLPADATFGAPSDEGRVVQQWRTAVGALKHFADNGCVYLVDDTNGNGSNHDENFDRTITGKNALGVGPVWGLGYFISQGQIQRGNFDFGPLIGDAAGFIYTVELVTANKETPHLQEVSDFLQIVGQPDVQLDYLRARGGTPGTVFDDPSKMDDPALEIAYNDFVKANQENRAGSFPPYLLDLADAVGPLRDLITGHGSRDEVVESYLCKDSRHPSFAHYGSDEACISALRAIP